MDSSSPSLDLLSVGGASSQHLQHVSGMERTTDHFSGMDLGEGADDGLMAMDGTVLHEHHHVDGERQSSDDHFGHSMSLNNTADTGLVATTGIGMGKGLGKAGSHQSGEHSYDHFANGGMAMSSAGSTDTGIFSVSGVAMGHEKHHEMGKHGDKRFEDHFGEHGMALNNEDTDGMGLTDSHGATVNHTSHKNAPKNHFVGGSFNMVEGHGSNVQDEKYLKRNKHFVSFYT